MKSQVLFDNAKVVIPGGVNGPVRAFGAVGMTPRSFAGAKGDRIRDVEGNEYIDDIGSLSSVFFTPEKVRDYAGAQTCDTGRYTAYFKHMLDSGVYLAPSRFEAMFLSTAHTEADLQRTLDAVREFDR